MKLADILPPVDAPAVYFMQQTAPLRERVTQLEAVLIQALNLVTDPEAEAADADRLEAAILQLLEPTP